jgi:hypothetical protein
VGQFARKLFFVFLPSESFENNPGETFQLDTSSADPKLHWLATSMPSSAWSAEKRADSASTIQAANSPLAARA